MSKKGELPEILFVAPIGRGRDKIRHKHTVFEVIEKDDQGIPTLCRMMRDDEIVDLESRKYEGRTPTFITAYIQASNLIPKQAPPENNNPE